MLMMLTVLFALTACNKVADMVQDGLKKEEDTSESQGEEYEETEPADADEEESLEEEQMNDEEEDETSAIDKESSEADEADEKESNDENEKDEEEEIQLGDYEIYLGGEVIEEEDSIMIDGESNLIPGARVVGEVTVGDEEEPDFQMDTSEKVQDDGTFEM